MPKIILRLSVIVKSRLNRNLENFVQNEFEVAKHHEIETELILRRLCMKLIDLL